MIQLRNICMTHKKDLRELVTDLSFVLNDGDKAALIGEEGNGKSTLLKLIYNESTVKDYVEYSGDIIRNNCIFGYLSQEPAPEDGKKSVYEFLSASPGFLESEPGELAVQARKLYIPVDLLYSEQRMDTLSGGERVKICMIRILCRKPDVLLLDEPSNDIDIQTLQWLERFILEWKGPVLYISHDEMLLERTANKIIHLEQIRNKKSARSTVRALDYKTYVKNRMENLQKQEQVAKKERSDYKKQQQKLQQIRQKVAHQQDTITRQNPHGAKLLKKKMHALKSMEHRYEKEFDQMTEFPDVEEAIFIKFKDLPLLPPRKTILDLSLPELKAGSRILAAEIHLRILGGEKICLTGRNGVGKSTLIRQIAEILLPRNDIKAIYIPQNYEDMDGFGDNSGTTPVEFLSASGDKDETTEIRTFLGSLRYTADEMTHPLCDLSGGQKAKLMLLKMCMSGANVLILDEPTRNYSPLSGPVIRKMLTQFPGAIISISHDRKYIHEVCNKIYVLDENGLRQT